MHAVQEIQYFWFFSFASCIEMGLASSNLKFCRFFKLNCLIWPKHGFETSLCIASVGCYKYKKGFHVFYSTCIHDGMFASSSSKPCFPECSKNHTSAAEPQVRPSGYISIHCMEKNPLDNKTVLFLNLSYRRCDDMSRMPSNWHFRIG